MLVPGHKGYSDECSPVHQCDLIYFNLSLLVIMNVHSFALQCYLNSTVDKGLILSPADATQIDCYLDDDFLVYMHEDSQDPHCSHSGIVFIILAFRCPVLMKTCCQTGISLSPIDAENTALSNPARTFLPLWVRSTLLAMPSACPCVTICTLGLMKTMPVLSFWLGSYLDT